MAKIGLDMMHYAKITEDPDTGIESYAVPKPLSGAISVDLSITPIDAHLSADNRIYYHNTGFGSGKITMNLADILEDAQVDIFGAEKDTKGGIVSYAETEPVTLAIGFRAMKANSKYRYEWLYRVTLNPPSQSAKTKDGENIEYTTPTVEGSFTQRNKAETNGKHIYHYTMDEDGKNADSATITSWFETVKEPVLGA